MGTEKHILLHCAHFKTREGHSRRLYRCYALPSEIHIFISLTFHLFGIFHNIFVLHQIIDQGYYGEDQGDPHNNIREDL